MLRHAPSWSIVISTGLPHGLSPRHAHNQLSKFEIVCKLSRALNLTQAVGRREADRSRVTF